MRMDEEGKEKEGSLALGVSTRMQGGARGNSRAGLVRLRAWVVLAGNKSASGKS